MSDKKIIDLSYDIEEGMTSFNASWHTKVAINQLGRINFEGRVTRNISIGSHTGTHVDAPLHFIEDAKSIDEISLEKLIGKVSIIDLSFLKEDEFVTAQMLEKFNLETKILFNFGWGRYWNTKKFYKGYPFFSKDAAEYLVSRQVELIGMDTPSPDDSRVNLSGDLLGSRLDSPIHKIFLSNNIVLVEYIANLDKVKDLLGWNVIVMPLKIKGSDGSSARVCIYKEN